MPVETVTNQSLTLSFSFGDRAGQYSGELVSGLPEGNGAFSSVNDDGITWTYIGEWVSGHFEGLGSTAWDDGFSESGMYKNDLLNGQGREGWNGGVKYEGSYKDSEYDGQGTYYNSYEEIVYSGSFSNGLIKESAQDRDARVSAFKDESIPLDIGDLYGSCQKRVSMRVEVKGDVFYVSPYPETNPTFCEIFIYEGGIHDTDSIVCIYYQLSEGEALPVENQNVTIWGTTDYLYTYTSVENEELTVPLIEAWSVE